MIKINSKVNKPTKSRWYQRAVHRIAAWMLFMVDVYIPKEFDDMSLWERQRQAKGIPIMRCYTYNPKLKAYERNQYVENRINQSALSVSNNTHKISAQEWVIEG